MAVLSPRYPAVALALTLTAAALSGCAPAPEPSPTPTAMFASEEEAFAAAEEVYRAYIDAGNNGADESDFLVGQALEAEIDTLRYLDENGLTLDGTSALTSFVGVEATVTPTDTTIEVLLCLDVSKTRVLDSSGSDVTPADRANRVSLDVSFVTVESAVLISESTTSEEGAC